MAVVERIQKPKSSRRSAPQQLSESELEVLAGLLERAMPIHHSLRRSPRYGWHLYEYDPAKADMVLRYSDRSVKELFGRRQAGIILDDTLKSG